MCAYLFTCKSPEPNPVLSMITMTECSSTSGYAHHDDLFCAKHYLLVHTKAHAL